MPTLPLQGLNIIPACWEAASACGEGVWVARRGVSLDWVFTVPIDLHSVRGTRVPSTPLPAAVLQPWGHVAWVKVRSGLSGGLAGPGDEESDGAVLQALGIC